MTREEAIALAVAYSMIPPARMGMMIDVCDNLPPGGIVQCGVFRGGSAAILGWALPGRPLWLFDRFTGIPRPGPLDGERAIAKWRPAWCEASLSDVGTALALLGVEPDRVRIIGGAFADTLNLVDVGPLALLHVDADWYESTGACLVRFLPDMVPGGVVIVDDYHHWPGCKRAVDEWHFNVNEMDGTAIWFRV